jgi:hypothetical protein
MKASLVAHQLFRRLIMLRPGDYKALPEENTRYRIKVDIQPNAKLWAYYRGSSAQFQIYKDKPIRRAADGEIITAYYNRYYAIRSLGVMALLTALLSIFRKDPVVGVISGVSGVLLLGLAWKLTQRSKAEAIDSLEERVRREINARENAVRDTGRLHEQGAQRVRAASPQPNIMVVNNNSNTIFQPPNSQSPLSSSAPPANYQAAHAQVPPQEEYPQEGQPSQQVGYGYQTTPSFA